MAKSSSSNHDRRMVEIPAGDFLFHQGELGTEMFVVHEGEVEILRTVDGGSESLTEPLTEPLSESVAVLEKGDFFGEMSLLEEVPRSASARARTKTKVLRVDGAMFTDLVRSQPEFAVRIMRRLSGRLREMGEQLAALGARAASPAGETTETEPASDPEETTTAAIVKADLVHQDSGNVFMLRVRENQPAMVGRGDPITGAQPAVDLALVDEERSSSRRHAKFLVQDSGLFVVEELGATNGTFLNDQKIKPGEPAEVRSGDRIRFGLVTLELSLR